MKFAVLSASLMVAGCMHTDIHAAEPAGTRGAILSDLIKPIKNPFGARPSNTPYYAAVYVDFNSNMPINDNACIDKSFLSMLRSLFGVDQSASSAVSAKISPVLNEHPTVDVPIYMSQIREMPRPGEPKCLTLPIRDGAQITASMPSIAGAGYTITFTFNQIKQVSGGLIENAGGIVTEFVSTVAGATGLGVISGAGRDRINAVARRLDLVRSSLYSESAQVPIVKSFYFFPSNETDSQDSWYLSIKNPNSSGTGIDLSSWQPVIRIYMRYATSIVKSENLPWPTPDKILGTSLFPSSLSELNTINSVLRDNRVGGVNLSGLSSSDKADEIRNQCSVIKEWLSSFLVGDDELVVRYAIMYKYSAYDRLYHIRSKDCFSEPELRHLAAISNNEYRFADPTPRKTNRNGEIQQLGLLLSGALDRPADYLDELRNIVTAPMDYFVLRVPGKPSQYGEGALKALKSAVGFSCYQARKDSDDLRVIGGFVEFSDGRKPALVSYDPSGKIEQVEIVEDVATVRHVLRLDDTEWPGNRPSCAVASRNGS